MNESGSIKKSPGGSGRYAPKDVVVAKYDRGMDFKFEFTETGNAVFSGGEFEMIPSLSSEVGSIFSLIMITNLVSVTAGYVFTRRGYVELSKKVSHSYWVALLTAKEEPYASIPLVIDGLLRVHKRTVNSPDVDLSNASTPLSFLIGEGTTLPKLAILSRTPIQIRETLNGGITLAGVTEPEVRSKEEMTTYLSRGSLARAIGSTNMSSQSSGFFRGITHQVSEGDSIHYEIIEDMSIQTNVPALAMEVIVPVAVSDVTMLAPEEVFAGKEDIKEKWS
ncbi:hypothetical protein GIB67_021976 [Kingdonia uniflora]|uniref:Uncharacterized protein n=1 Tax=Kingdonia uniflora TaxID=39325 RepID=A0A7J7P7T4_9MAGN|nr:hypothetical protein GIB67_021976 [Kingdonia uniflora]